MLLFFSLVLCLHHVHSDFVWDFIQGADGWAQSTYQEMAAEVAFQGGDFRGRTLNKMASPHITSPSMYLNVDDKYVVGMRIKVSTQRSVVPEMIARLHDAQVSVPFSDSVAPDGAYHIVYALMHAKLQGILTQLEILPLGHLKDSWSAFDIDWIKIEVVPTIEQVHGCMNNHSTTFNCPRRGNIPIQISGRHFGKNNAVFIGSTPCTNAHLVEVNVVECDLPPYTGQSQQVRISKNEWLSDTQQYLQYAVPAALEETPPEISHIRASAIDVKWQAAPVALTVTGYQVNVFMDDKAIQQVIVGNFTNTTIISLEPNRFYSFSIQALVHELTDDSWRNVNIYGHQLQPLSLNTILKSDPTNVSDRVLSLAYDIDDFSMSLEGDASITPDQVLRLTESQPRSIGTAWYHDEVNVVEGFKAEFQFEISNPSETCKIMDDVFTHCRASAGEGFSFIVSHENTSLVVEFDTLYNPEKSDSYENTISIKTDTDGVIASSPAPVLKKSWIQIVFRKLESIHSMTIHSKVPTTWYNQDLGSVSVSVDGIKVLSTVINMPQIIHSAVAKIGFTASTSDIFFQTHEITNWKFISTRDPF